MKSNAGIAWLLAGLSFVTVAYSPAGARSLSDAEIKQAIIQQSLASYPGNCPCPYSTMRNGRSCGGRSAYSRPGGYAPICFESQITPEMVRAFRAGH
jgi:hypothetical protein